MLFSLLSALTLLIGNRKGIHLKKPEHRNADGGYLELDANDLHISQFPLSLTSSRAEVKPGMV